MSKAVCPSVTRNRLTAEGSILCCLRRSNSAVAMPCISEADGHSRSAICSSSQRRPRSPVASSGLPPPGNVFYQMKSRDTFAPLGPYIVTADEIRDPHQLQVRLWVNGVLKQNFNTSDMAHKIPRCIEWVSSIHTLEPGDVLATGTNHRGLSSFQDGDVVELESDGLGRLRFHVRDELKRTWGRETRLDMANKGGKEVTTPQLTGKYAAARS